MKTTILFLALSCLSIDQAFADAALSIGRGRMLLAAHNLPAANLAFKQAVAMEPNNAEANLYYGVTRIAILNANPTVQALMDRMGISRAGRNIFDWQAKGSGH